MCGNFVQIVDIFLTFTFLFAFLGTSTGITFFLKIGMKIGNGII
jgi:hypothetical protein